MTQVRLPDGNIGNFPDGMSNSDIEQVLQKQYPSAQPQAAIPSPSIGQSIADLGRGTRMAIPYSDRALAAVQSVLPGGQPYAQNLATSQAADADLRARHSITGNLGQGVGAMAAAAPAAMIAPEAGAGLLARGLVGAAQGGAIGGLQGASQSPDQTNIPQTMANAGAGAGAGLAVGGALPLAAGLLGKIPIAPKPPGNEFTSNILKAGNIPVRDVSPASLKEASARITEPMADIAGRNEIAADLRPGLNKQIDAAVGDQTTANPTVLKYANQIKDMPEGPIPGSDYATLRSELTNKAYRSRINDPDSSDAWRGMRDALDTHFDQSLAVNKSPDVGALQPLRQSYGHLMDVAEAAARPKQGADQSVLTPQAMQQALVGGGGNNPQNYAMNQGPLAAITHQEMAKAPSETGGGSISHFLWTHAGRALAGGLAGYEYGGLPLAAAGAIGGYALPKTIGGITNVRQLLGKGVAGPNADLEQPGLSPYLQSLARALLAKQLAGQTNAP